MAGNNQGLGSDSMSQADKDKIHSMGGKASHSAQDTNMNSGEVITNKSGGGALDKEAQRKGGQSSRRR
jgi:hypothetical protein